MKVENRVFPNREQMKGFFENTDDNEPIYMLNLLKFKEKAEYKDGRETNLTGREAYTIYAEFMDELWDVVAIAKWPSRKIMGENMMPSDPEYLEAYQHREAGLAGQLNIETKEIND